MKATFFIVLFTVVLFSCKKDPAIPVKGITDVSTLAEDRNFLSCLRKDIIDLADSKPCTDPSNWKTTGFSIKACGGYWDAIAYSKDINERAFLEKVSYFHAQQRLFNQKYGWVSDCSFVIPSSKVVCENGKAKVVD